MTAQSKTPTVHAETPDAEEIELSNKDASMLDQDAIDEEDDLDAEIDQLVKKKVPKKRRTLKSGKGKKMDNLPPKRIKPDDVKELFPHLKIEHDEQRRLAKIASSISGLAY